MIPKITQSSLYDRDFALWLEDTAAKLKARDIHNLDWDNLVEEIEALGISQKHEVESRLKTILTHILKRLLWHFHNRRQTLRFCLCYCKI